MCLFLPILDKINDKKLQHLQRQSKVGFIFLLLKLLTFVNPVSVVEFIFVRSKFKIKLFLNDLWYEPETLWLVLTFTKYYFAEKEIEKTLNFQMVTYLFTMGYCQKLGVRICRNSLSRRSKYIHVWEIVSTSSFNFVKRLRRI